MLTLRAEKGESADLTVRICSVTNVEIYAERNESHFHLKGTDGDRIKKINMENGLFTLHVHVENALVLVRSGGTLGGSGTMKSLLWKPAAPSLLATLLAR